MHGTRFDRLTRGLAETATRRGILVGLATLGQVTVGLPVVAKKSKIKKLKRNEFGCVDVGGKCRGNSANCCSGVCEGKKPKKDKKDRSRCVAHDAGAGCQTGQQTTFCRSGEVTLTSSNCTSSAGSPGLCQTTTGNAPYCTASSTCFQCNKDTECETVCGQGAACVRCVGCDETGGTACVSSTFHSCGP
jgi:hypothetical protein